jgi:hypothetical protein
VGKVASGSAGARLLKNRPLEVHGARKWFKLRPVLSKPARLTVKLAGGVAGLLVPGRVGQAPRCAPGLLVYKRCWVVAHARP